MNTASISSDQTPEDPGEDSVTVAVEPREDTEGGNPTPEPNLPDTAVGTSIGGEPVNVPVELLAVIFLGSLGALALATGKARGGRR